MPKLREMAKIIAKKKNSDEELLIKLKMQPLSSKTKAQATNAALNDMSPEQRQIVLAKEL